MVGLSQQKSITRISLTAASFVAISTSTSIANHFGQYKNGMCSAPSASKNTWIEKKEKQQKQQKENKTKPNTSSTLAHLSLAEAYRTIKLTTLQQQQVQQAQQAQQQQMLAQTQQMNN